MKWISVKDRLPEANLGSEAFPRQYLITDGKSLTIMRYEIDLGGDGLPHWWTEKQFPVIEESEITHWAPLLKPPEE